jgi:hypothetical protein
MAKLKKLRMVAASVIAEYPTQGAKKVDKMSFRFDKIDFLSENMIL